MICVFNKSVKWAGSHLHSHLNAALWILNHRFTHFINEHVPSSALHSSPERKLSELFLNSEFLSEKQPLVLIFFFFSSGTELWTSYLILETDSGSCRSWHGQSFFALPCYASFTAPANTTLCRPLQPRLTFSASSCRLLWAPPKLIWQRRHGEEKKQVNVISLGTPPWALCYCHICRHIIDFYTVAWKESLTDQNLEVLLSR